MDLTRDNATPDARFDLVEDPRAGGALLIPPSRRLGGVKRGVTPMQACEWGRDVLQRADIGAHEVGAMVFTADGVTRSGRPKGSAWVGVSDRFPLEDECDGDDDDDDDVVKSAVTKLRCSGVGSKVDSGGCGDCGTASDGGAAEMTSAGGNKRTADGKDFLRPLEGDVPGGTMVYVWTDTDAEAAAYHLCRIAGDTEIPDEVPITPHHNEHVRPIASPPSV